MPPFRPPKAEFYNRNLLKSKIIIHECISISVIPKGFWNGFAPVKIFNAILIFGVKGGSICRIEDRIPGSRLIFPKCMN
jgi:hypothetical protein